MKKRVNRFLTVILMAAMLLTEVMPAMASGYAADEEVSVDIGESTRVLMQDVSGNTDVSENRNDDSKQDIIEDDTTDNIDNGYASTEYSITYYNCYGAVNDNPTSVIEGTEVELSNASREGFDFIGWYTDEELTNKTTSITPAENVILYAKWEDTTDNIASGAYKNTVWAIDVNGKLTVEGVGNFAPQDECGYNVIPWYYNIDDIVSAKVSLTETTNASYMFADCWFLKEVDLSEFDTSLVNDMGSMFQSCGLEKLDLSNFNTGNVIYMDHMFYASTELSELNVSSFDTRKVVDMDCMFQWCKSLKELDLSSFDMSSVRTSLPLDMIFLSRNDSLYLIKTPRNLKLNSFLPNYNDSQIWRDSTGKVYTYLPTNLDKSIQLSTKSIYSITYKNCSGAENPNPKSYTYGEGFSLKAPTKTGYTFVGWYTDSGCTKKITAISSSAKKNYTLYAKWSTNKYSVVFNRNEQSIVPENGVPVKPSGKMASLSVSYGKTTYLTANAFKITGYKFMGWNTEPDGSGNTFANKAKIVSLSSVNKDKINLYAQWEPVVYKITYKNVINEVIPTLTGTYTVESETITLETPEQAGCEFIGWYSDSKLTKAITQIKAGSYGNKTIYAKWKANKYNIVFNANSGSGKMDKLKNLSCGKYYSLTKNKFTKKGYTFVGWNTEPDGSGESFANAAKVVTLSAENGATVTLYAQWVLTNYRITYKNVSGDTINENVTSYTMCDETIVLSAPTRTGYDFVAWYSDSQLTKKITEIKAGSTGSKTIYAKWRAHKYSVKFDSNAQGRGTVKGSTKSMTGKSYGSKFALTQNGFTLSGYKFLGWSKDPDATTANYKDMATVSNLTSEQGDVVVLYAVWKKK